MWQYSVVGIGTFILDLAIIYALTNTKTTSDTTALVIGFGTGITINYLLSYYWVYRGTKRHFLTGFIIFLTLAILGSVCIVFATHALISHFALPLLIARTIVAAAVGFCNFLINTFFNFRLL